MDKSKRLLPAYPLFVKDPYFSIWSTTDVLNDGDTSFWTGKLKRTYGLISANGKNYCFLGNANGVQKIKQTKIEVTTFKTIYSFECDEFDFTVSFFSPLPINNYEIWACPTAFLEYQIHPKTLLKNVRVTLSLHEDWCYYSEHENEVRGDVFILKNKEVGWFGLNVQKVLNISGDRFGADWGYYYIVADSCYYHSINNFENISTCEFETDSSSTKYLTGENFHDTVNDTVSGKILVAFDDVVSVNYFGELLRGYYFTDNKNIIDAINFSLNEYEKISNVCEEIEKELISSTKNYSDKYIAVLNASYRQTLAAHKLVKDKKDRLLLLSKECGSGGCVATVDVTYPTMPMFLLYNTELVRASIEPIFDFAKMDAWEYDFAPHDAGVYPYCNGQFYGVKNKESGKYTRAISYQGREDFRCTVLPPYYLYPKGSDLYDYDRQMPIEECSDMILICASYLACGGEDDYIRDKMPLLKQWCDYLIYKGLIPENQLCTDDFLMHIDKNVNLAIKATISISAYAKLAKKFGEEFEKYEIVSKDWAMKLKTQFKDRCMPLSFDSEKDSFSMKYNLAPSKLLGLNVFCENDIRKEIQVCLDHNGDFGFPLDNRSNLTKTDWMMWMASLTDNREEQNRIIEYINNYLVNGVDRVPFADLYDCVTGVAREFTNRTVQGSMFILLLKDKLLGLKRK